jgi:acetylornithine/succinyldiaminopimelate/putrescine aminotransferase
LNRNRELFRRHLAQTSDAPLGLEISRAQGSWLYTADGRRYLDLIAGIGVSALGHGHPAVLDAIRRQMERHLHVMVYGEYVIKSQVELATRLAELLPASLSKVYFTNSGTEAVEGALKTARKLTGRQAFVAFEGAYHGDTMGALALAGNPEFRQPFGSLPGPVRHLPYDVEYGLDAIGDDTAAVIVEPVQAEGGVRIPSVNFMQAVRERCRATGALLIFDEVLTGLGRTGRLFAFEHFDVVPDVLVLAKALGGGLPLGAFCASDTILSVLAHDPPLGHITTFGGHPLSCAAGREALEVIVRERLWEQAEALGGYMVDCMQGWSDERIRDVRGRGLLIGIEFHSAKQARNFVFQTIARDVIVNWTLNADNVVRLAPPLTLCRDEANFALNAMAAALTASAGR